MQIDADLNLVFPIRYQEVERPDPKNPGKTLVDFQPLLWAYHTPISRQVFESAYRLLAAVKDALCPVGNWSTSSTMIAALTLKDAGRRDAEQWGLAEGLTMEAGGSAQPLLAELKRLTTVLSPGATGYEALPAELAISKKIITEDEWMDAESALVFFTCASSLTQRGLRAAISPAFAAALRGSTTSLTPTAFAASLAISTAPETSEVSAPSSVPS